MERQGMFLTKGEVMLFVIKFIAILYFINLFIKEEKNKQN